MLHLNDGLLFRSQILLHVLFQSSQHHWLQDTLQLLNLIDKWIVSVVSFWTLASVTLEVQLPALPSSGLQIQS